MLKIISISVLIIMSVLMIKGVYKDFFDAFINALAGTVSFACTSGFPLERVNTWPPICKMILFILMMIGGSANSTSGGIKIIRFGVFIKLIKRGFYKRIHPQAMKPILIKDSPVSPENVSSISTFILLYVGVYLFSCLVLSLENLSFETIITAPMALLSNCGVAFDSVASGSYQLLSSAGRLYAVLLMMLGRLEIYAVLILFSRSFWNGDRVK